MIQITRPVYCFLCVSLSPTHVSVNDSCHMKANITRYSVHLASCINIIKLLGTVPHTPWLLWVAMGHLLWSCIEEGLYRWFDLVDRFVYQVLYIINPIWGKLLVNMCICYKYIFVTEYMIVFHCLCLHLYFRIDVIVRIFINTYLI